MNGMKKSAIKSGKRKRKKFHSPLSSAKKRYRKMRSMYAVMGNRRRKPFLMKTLNNKFFRKFGRKCCANKLSKKARNYCLAFFFLFVRTSDIWYGKLYVYI